MTNVVININKYDVPILLITYNRLDTLTKVIDSIRILKPKKLYLASDGPNPNKLADHEKVKQVREFLATAIDWDCEVKTLFRDKNLGCKYGVSTAIDWFFEYEEYGIILEDDTVPNFDFFYFLEHCLIKYSDEPNVMMITGTNFLDKMSSDTPPLIFLAISVRYGDGGLGEEHGSYMIVR